MLLNYGSDRSHLTKDGRSLDYLCESGGHPALLDGIKRDPSSGLYKIIVSSEGTRTAGSPEALDSPSVQKSRIINDYSHNLDTSTASPLWVGFCRIITLPVLPIMLRWVGIKDPLAQQAWREKVGLCLIILAISAVMGFLTFGLTTLVCRSPLPITLEQVCLYIYIYIRNHLIAQY
jgi:hypothetical protein